MYPSALLIAALIGLAAPTLASAAEVAARQAVVRATSEGQGASIAFVELRARRAATLVGAESPVCELIELHEMKRERTADATVVSMNRVQAIVLKPGRVVQLKPGGDHLMLMRLKRQLTAGMTVPITLKFVDASGAPFAQDIVARVGGEQRQEGDH